MRDVLLVALNAQYVHTALGIRSIAAYAREQADIDCLELTINDSFAASLETIYQRRAPLIGFSCYIWNIEQTLRLAQALHAMDSSLTIVLGGPEVSYDAEEWLEKYPYVYAIFCGEGEIAFSNFLGEWQKEKNWYMVGGLCWRDEERIIQNPPAAFLSGEEIPFGYDWQNLPKSPQIIYYESSRGCPYHCAFCLSAGDKLRFRSAEKTIEDLQKLAEAGVAQVKFVDRTFNADLPRAKKIWRAMAVWDTPCNFHFEIAAKALDDEAIEILQRMPLGRVQVEIGIQSTNEPTKRAIDRDESFAVITDVVQRLQKNNNIHIHLDLIAGLPEDTWTTFGQSFCDGYALKPDMLQLGFLKLLRGSKLREVAKEFGCFYSAYAPYEVLRTATLSPTELFDLKRCEHAVDMYAHSNQCQQAMEYLNKKMDDPFQFYVDLGRWIANRAIHKQWNRIEALWSFAQEYGYADQCLYELLLFDYLKTERRAQLPLGAKKPSGELEQKIRQFYRFRAKELWGDQVRTPWRFTQIHPFSYDVLQKTCQKKDCLVLFDYQANTQIEIKTL